MRLPVCLSACLPLQGLAFCFGQPERPGQRLKVKVNGVSLSHFVGEAT
ncbi:hypothetical protein [Erwinia rhapontici]|nr:hypothetical protein [Erwinia rhapontici]